jgi:hypothetical protein
MASALGAAPLAVIPYIETSADIAQYRRTKQLTNRALMAGFVVIVVLVQFLWLPLDVIWFKGMRVISNLVGG